MHSASTFLARTAPLLVPLFFGACAATPSASRFYAPAANSMVARAPAALPPSLGVGAFGGLGLGQSEFHDYELDSLPGANADTTDTSFAAIAGYRWTPNYGMLLGFIDHGTLEADGPIGEGGQPFEDSIDYKSVILCAMASAPIARGVAVYGLVGAAHWTQDVEYTEGFSGKLTEGTPGTVFKEDASGVSPAIGGGINYFIDTGGHFGLNLAWVRVFEAGDKGKTGHDSDIDFVSFGMIVSQ